MRQKETKGKKQGNTGIRGETVNELSKTKIQLGLKSIKDFYQNFYS